MSIFAIQTEDGSKTLFSPEFGEHFHSKYGAITESMHVFIGSGLLKRASIGPLNVLEMGFGTGLNALLTAIYTPVPIIYTGIEAYPLSNDVINQLSYPEAGENADALFKEIHAIKWGEHVAISPMFMLKKVEDKLEDVALNGPFDLVYFDAFAPDVQPELWTVDVFRKIADACAEGAVLTTYSAKGQVRRNLMEAGFEVERIPGPPGKREMLRGTKK